MATDTIAKGFNKEFKRHTATERGCVERLSARAFQCSNDRLTHGAPLSKSVLSTEMLKCNEYAAKAGNARLYGGQELHTFPVHL